MLSHVIIKSYETIECFWNEIEIVIAKFSELFQWLVQWTQKSFVSVCLSVCLPVRPSICLSVCLLVCSPELQARKLRRVNWNCPSTVQFVSTSQPCENTNNSSVKFSSMTSHQLSNFSQFESLTFCQHVGARYFLYLSILAGLIFVK